MLRIVGLICTAGAACAGCVHEPAEAICPPVGAGDLVVTEIRASGDPNGTWIEVFNATGSDLDLEGTQVRVLSVDGATDLRMLIRRPVPLVGGDYVVLGAFDDDDRPAHVDYGFGPDFAADAPPSGAVTITACDVQVDRVVFDALPSTGTWSLGTSPPSAEGNDDQSTWCTGTDTGSPGSGNPPCV